MRQDVATIYVWRRPGPDRQTGRDAVCASCLAKGAEARYFAGAFRAGPATLSLDGEESRCAGWEHSGWEGPDAAQLSFTALYCDVCLECIETSYPPVEITRTT